MNRPRKATITFIFITLFLDTLGVGIMVPVCPLLVSSFASDDVGNASRYYGALLAVYSLMQFICAPIIGALSDRFGRRIVILTSLCGAALDYLLFAFSPSLGWLFFARLISGVTGASITAANSYVADISPPEDRSKNFGLMGAALGLGFVLGPALGGLVGGLNLRAPFIIAAALHGLNLLYGIFVLPESLAPEHRRPVSLARVNPFGALRRLGRTPVLVVLSVTMVCGFLVEQILQAVWAIDTQARFGWSSLHIGLSMAVGGVMIGLVQGALLPKVTGKIGDRATVLVGLLFSVLGFISFATATHGWTFLATIFPYALSGLAMPALQALASNEVGPSEQGELQGSIASLRAAMSVLGPLLGTAVYARFAPASAEPHVPGAAFLLAAVLNTFAGLVAWRLFARSPQREAA